VIAFAFFAVTNASTCNFYASFNGYACELIGSNLDVPSTIVGTHLDGKSDDDVVYVHTTLSTMTTVTSIVTDAFVNLKYYRLIDTGVLYLTAKSFTRCQHLLSLQLQINSIGEVPANAFSNCNLLISLNVSKNMLTEIHDNGFAGLGALIALDLSFNSLTEIGANTFRSLAKLTSLNLSNNQINNINAGALSPLINLKQLWLSNNQLTLGTTAIFFYTKEIEELHLNGNDLRNFNFYALLEHTKLERVGLGSCNIRNLMFTTYGLFSQVKWLDLNNNLLPDIIGNQIYGLWSVEHLILSENKFTKLETVDFRMLTNVISIDFGHNQINKIAPTFFNNFKNISRVEAEGNLCISKNVYDGSFESSFKTCFDNYNAGSSLSQIRNVLSALFIALFFFSSSLAVRSSKDHSLVVAS